MGKQQGRVIPYSPFHLVFPMAYVLINGVAVSHIILSIFPTVSFLLHFDQASTLDKRKGMTILLPTGNILRNITML